MENNARCVSSYLTWEMVFNASFRHSFPDSETIKTDAMKDQLCLGRTAASIENASDKFWV